MCAFPSSTHSPQKARKDLIGIALDLYANLPSEQY